MIVSSVLPAIGLFIVTNIDDIIVLSLFFARGAGQRGTTARITAGQYLGFAGILGAAVPVTAGAFTERSTPALTFAVAGAVTASAGPEPEPVTRTATGLPAAPGLTSISTIRPSPRPRRWKSVPASPRRPPAPCPR